MKSPTGETSLWPIYALAALVLVGVLAVGALLVVPELVYWRQHGSLTAVSGDEGVRLLGWAVLPSHWSRLSQGYPSRLRTVADRPLLFFVAAELLLLLVAVVAGVTKTLERFGDSGRADDWRSEEERNPVQSRWRI